MYVCMNACMYARVNEIVCEYLGYIYICLQVYMLPGMFVCVCVRVCQCVCALSRVCMCVYMSVYMLLYVYIGIPVWMCVCVWFVFFCADVCLWMSVCECVYRACLDVNYFLSTIILFFTHYFTALDVTLKMASYVITLIP